MSALPQSHFSSACLLGGHLRASWVSPLNFQTPPAGPQVPSALFLGTQVCRLTLGLNWGGECDPGGGWRVMLLCEQLCPFLRGNGLGSDPQSTCGYPFAPSPSLAQGGRGGSVHLQM